MDDIINKILEMDETARKYSEQVESEKIASRNEVLKKRQAVYDEYLESAREHVEKFKEAAAKDSENDWKKTEQYYARISNALESDYKENKSKWVDAIVNEVISG